MLNGGEILDFEENEGGRWVDTYKANKTYTQKIGEALGNMRDNLVEIFKK